MAHILGSAGVSAKNGSNNIRAASEERRREREKREADLFRACRVKADKVSHLEKLKESELDWGGNPVARSRRKIVPHVTSGKEVEKNGGKGRKHFERDVRFVSVEAGARQFCPGGTNSASHWKSNTQLQNMGRKMAIGSEEVKPRTSRGSVDIPYLLSRSERASRVQGRPLPLLSSSRPNNVSSRPSSLLSDSLFDDIATSTHRERKILRCPREATSNKIKPLPGYTGRAERLLPRESHNKAVDMSYRPF